MSNTVGRIVEINEGADDTNAEGAGDWAANAVGNRMLAVTRWCPFHTC